MPASESIRSKIEGREFLTVAELEMMGLQIVRGSGKLVSFRTMQKQRQFFHVTDNLSASGNIVKGREGETTVGRPCYLVEEV